MKYESTPDIQANAGDALTYLFCRFAGFLFKFRSFAFYRDKFTGYPIFSDVKFC
jgi:hypothetical protein